MRPSATRRRLLAVVTALAVVVAACGDDDDAAPSTTTTTAAPTTTVAPGDPTTTTAPGPTPPEIVWEDCGSNECATVAVPLDHDDPDGPTIDLNVERRPASGERIGAVFFNFGGPGAETANQLRQWPVPDRILERFDVVAVDPRGVGRSTPLSCGLDAGTYYGIDPTIEDAADASTLTDAAERYADDCGDAHPELLPHLGTLDVARDLDLIRAGLGDEQLSYVGYSYGTSIGQAYAQLFPTRIRAMVLDGIVDPAPSGIETAVMQAQGFETALANWAAGCDGRGTCRFDDPIAAIEAVQAAAERGVPSERGRDLGPGEAAVAIAYPLYSQSLWPSLDRAVADALDGDGAAMVTLADAYLGLVDFTAYMAVSCLDSTWPDSASEHLAAAEDAAAVAPHFGEAIVNDYLRCAVWPAEPVPVGEVTAGQAPPIVVVGTTGDPATPYDNAVRVAARLASGILLTHEGEGHTIVFQGSGCVDDIVTSYIVDLATPRSGTRC